MHYSPLRYPGGKTKLLPFISALIKANNLVNHEYVEPYAGGAGVALGLLLNGVVQKIHINDFDPAIYAFWQSSVNQSEAFIAKILETPITVEEWHNQRTIYLNAASHSTLELGFATFFLNRCNHSGIIKGRMIGGHEQKSQWSIACRFNKEALIKRIQRIAMLKNNIKLYNLDTKELLQKFSVIEDPLFFYLDPPYYLKGKQLYQNFYTDCDHVEIAKGLTTMPHPWLVSYDNNTRIEQIYEQYYQEKVAINYSTGKTKIGTEIVIYSDNLSPLLNSVVGGSLI